MPFVPDTEETVVAGKFVPDDGDGKALPRTMTRGEQLTNHPLTKGAIGLAEAATGLATGLGTQVAGGLAGAGKTGLELLRGKPFTEAMESGAKTVEGVTDLAYQPRGAEGKALTQAVTYLPQKAAEGWGMIGGEVGELVGGEQGRIAGESLGKGGMEALMAAAPGPKILKQARAAAAAPKPLTVAETQATYGPERQTPQQIRATVGRVAPIEAAEAAQRHGIVVDLPELDTGSKMTRRLTSPEDVQTVMSEVNKGIPELRMKQAVGIPEERPLDATAIEANLERLSGPKKQIEQMSGFIDDGKTVAEIRALIPERTVGMGDEFKAAVAKVQKAAQDVTQGVGVGSGEAVISSIESLRKAARDIYSRSDISPELRNTADIYKGTANALEGLVERRLASTDPQLLNQYVQNRQTMAQTYLLRDLLDENTKTVRLDKLANMTSNDTGITGAFKDFGKIYAASPESFKPMTKEAAGTFRWSRYTIPGTIGSALGTMVGVGPIAGAGAGALVRNAIATRNARKLASPERQAGYTKALRNRSRTELGYEPVPPPLELAPQGPLPPSPMGGTVVGAGPSETGVINLAPQLASGLPSEGMGPQAALRSGARDVTPQSPQMPTVEMPLTPDMASKYLKEMMDAMQRGDEAAVDRIGKEFVAAQEALKSSAANKLLWEAPGVVVDRGFGGEAAGPQMPGRVASERQALKEARAEMEAAMKAKALRNRNQGAR